MKLSLRSVSAVAMLMLVSACGGSDAVDVEGNWKGTETDVASDVNVSGKPQSVRAVGAFREDGYGFVFDEHHNYFVTPPLGSNAVTVWDMAVVEQNGPIPLSALSRTADLVARFQLGDQAVAVSYTSPGVTGIKDCIQGCWIGSFDLRRSPSSAAPSSPPSGEWQGVNLSGYDFDTMSVNMAVDGSFSGEALGCRFSGTLTPVRAGEDLYDADADSTGCYIDGRGNHYRGLGYLSDKDEFGLFGKAPGTYFYLGVSASDAVRNNSGPFLFVEFKVR